MSEYVIQGQTLSDIADAIRAKSGAQKQYRPDQMAAAVDEIQSAKDVVEGTLAVFRNDKISNVRSLAFAHWIGLTECEIPNAIEIGKQAFYGCTNLLNVDLKSVKKIWQQCFQNCAALEKVYLPECTELMNYVFAYCTSLKYVAIGKAAKININFNDQMPNFLALVLTAADRLCTLTSTTSFQGTPNAYIYVPDVLVDQYKAATNWVTYADKIKPLSELPQEVQEWLSTLNS